MNESFSDLNIKNKQDLEGITEEIFNLLTPENQKELMGLINNTLRREMEELNKIDGDEILKKLKRKEYMKEYRQRSKAKERRIEYQREYYQIPKNKERIREYQRDHYQQPQVKEIYNQLRRERRQRKKSNKF